MSVWREGDGGCSSSRVEMPRKLMLSLGSPQLSLSIRTSFSQSLRGAQNYFQPFEKVPHATCALTAHFTLHCQRNVYDHSDDVGAARLCGALSFTVPVRRGRVRAHIQAGKPPTRGCQGRSRGSASRRKEQKRNFDQGFQEGR